MKSKHLSEWSVVMMIDTSIWIQFLRKNGDLNCKMLVVNALRAGKACYTCPVQLELTSGARRSEIANLKNCLKFATRVEVRAIHWDQAASLVRELKSRGLTVPVCDALIASVADQSGMPIVCQDKHFTHIRDEVLPGLEVMTPA